MTFLVQIDAEGKPISNPVDDGNFRALFPSTSFPIILTPASVEGTGFALYEFSQQPELQRYEKMVEGAPKKAADGRYFQNWEVVPMNDEEKAQRDAQEDASVRRQRNARLTMCDWTQLPDATLTAEQKVQWQSYRQALRDVTKQAGFPWSVQWPVQPE